MAGTVQPISAYVADTHALFWYLVRSPRLGSQARQAFLDAEQGLTLIYLPAIVLAELYYMNAKLHHPLDFADAVEMLRTAGQFVLLPFLPEETLDFERDRAAPEMHDRIIVGVARRLSLPLLTCDVSITASNLVTVVW